ncbi:hypothetical protein [Kineococcus terrestris]|uniref:hypothetical protein n=1 Tax=Kineococcus terrestris TaxID=2044856 RepID=UPI0034DB2CDC
MPTRAVVLTTPSTHARLDAFLAGWRRWTGDAPIEVVEGIEVPRAPWQGAFLAHVGALLAAGPRELAVFEDGAVLAAGFDLDVRPPRAWDLAYLGHELRAPLAEAVEGSPWVVPTEVARTHGYVVRNAEAVGRQLSRRGGEHVDYALSRLPLRRFALVPATVGQAAGVLDPSTGRELAEDAFWHDSPWLPAAADDDESALDS